LYILCVPGTPYAFNDISIFIYIKKEYGYYVVVFGVIVGLGIWRMEGGCVVIRIGCGIVVAL
jgi:hypothetical protein